MCFRDGIKIIFDIKCFIKGIKFVKLLNRIKVFKYVFFFGRKKNFCWKLSYIIFIFLCIFIFEEELVIGNRNIVF